RHVFFPEFICAFGVLEDELAVHDGPDEWIAGPHLADARSVTAVAAVSRSIFCRVLLKRGAIFLRNEMVEHAVVSAFDLRIALRRLAAIEVSDRIVALERDASLEIELHKRLAAIQAVLLDEAGPVRVGLLHV